MTARRAWLASAEKKELDRNLSELEGMMFAQRSTLERLRTEIRDCEQDDPAGSSPAGSG
jgi:hypothetical protein